MALIIEELNRAHRVLCRVRMAGESLTLGRGYNNGVIVEDPHADATHAEVVCDEDGCYYLRDLNSTNGTRLLGNWLDKSVKAAEISEHRIQSGDELQIGKSRLRFTHSETELPPAIPLHSAESLFSRLGKPSVAIGLGLLVSALVLWLGYQATSREFPWTKGVQLISESALGLLVYAAVWSFIGRVVRHESHFFAHLSIAASGALIYAGWQWFSSLLDFNYSVGALLPLLDILALGILLPAMLWCAAYLALNIAPHWRWAAAVLLPWSFLGLATAVHLGDINEFNEQPRFSTELKSDNLLWRNPRPLDEFLASTPALFDIPLEDKDKQQDKSKEQPNEQPKEPATEQQTVPTEDEAQKPAVEPSSLTAR